MGVKTFGVKILKTKIWKFSFNNIFHLLINVLNHLFFWTHCGMSRQWSLVFLKIDKCLDQVSSIREGSNLKNRIVGLDHHDCISSTTLAWFHLNSNIIQQMTTKYCILKIMSRGCLGLDQRFLCARMSILRCVYSANHFLYPVSGSECVVGSFVKEFNIIQTWNCELLTNMSHHSTTLSALVSPDL